MKKLFPFIAISLLLIITVLFSPILVHAQEYFFQDEFNQERPNNTLDTNKWTIYPNADPNITTIKETGGSLITSQKNLSHQYPLIISQNAFPNGDFSAEIKFQYTKVTNWGTGFALSEGTPTNGSGNINTLLAFQIWQDLSSGPYLRITYNGQNIFTTSTPNTSMHTIKVERISTKYLVYLDSVLIFTSPDTAIQTKYIWLGNPVYLSGLVPEWTSFNIDYVRIKQQPLSKTPIIIVPGIASSSNWGILSDRGDTGWHWMVTTNSSWRQFIDSLEKAGYQKDKDFFIAFYDWRKTNDWTDPDPGAALPAKKYLAEAIDKAKTANPGISKVNVIAHSMGGLVVKSYVESPNYRGDINKAFLIGSPNAGSTFAYYTWEGGEVPPNWDPVQKAALGMIIKLLSINFNEDPYQMIHNHMKGIKDLLPVGYNYLSKNNNLIDWTGMFEVNNFLKNTSMPQNTASIFASKGVGLVNVTGTGQTTWEKLQVQDYSDSSLWKDGKPVGNSGTSDGDNTVLASSSNLPGAEQLSVASNHANLPNTAASQIFNKLGINYTPSYLAGAPDEVLVAWVASPVNLEIKDNQGNSVGETLVDPDGEMKWVFVENPGNDYKINLTGTGNGQYHVGVDYYTDSKTESFQTQGTAVSGALLNYDLHLDPQNTQPINLQPEDKIPPVTISQAQGTLGNNSWYTSDVIFSLSATDNAGGSGVDKTEYSFDNTTWQRYTVPLTIDKEGIIPVYYRSFDLVGNQESTQQINVKIDKTAPEANIYVDADKDDLVVKGADKNPTIIQRLDNTETRKKDDAIYVVTDEAGNSLKLDVRERDKAKQDRFRIYSLQYNNSPKQILENNHFNVTYQGKKGKLNIKEQNFELKGEIKVRIQYDVKKDKSTVIVKEPKQERIKEVKNGLVILQLTTNNGALEAIY